MWNRLKPGKANDERRQSLGASRSCRPLERNANGHVRVLPSCPRGLRCTAGCIELIEFLARPEPCEGKLSRTVLRGAVSGQPFAPTRCRNMSTRRRMQRIIIGAFGLILTFPGLLMLFESDAPWWFRVIGFSLAAVVITPSIAFICGVNWCRFIVGALAAVFLLFWSLSPMAQHAIDRSAGFWCFWAIIEVLLFATLVASFKQTSEVKDAA